MKKKSFSYLFCFTVTFENINVGINIFNLEPVKQCQSAVGTNPV